MNEPVLPGPDEIASTTDPGDDIARRYRYQWTMSAIFCCLLLDETEGVKELFCEQHEDTLIKHGDDSFSGIQVKTRNRASDTNPIKSSDVIDSCIRFAKLEERFPGRFRSFRYLTNHPLYVAKNGQDFRFVLNTITDATSVNDLSGPALKYLSRISKYAEVSKDVVFTVLCKTMADDSLPKLLDIESRLINTLTNVWPRAADALYITLRRAASYLTWECGRASSLAHEELLQAYLPIISNPEESELKTLIERKRIDKSKLLKILDVGIDEISILEGAPESLVEPGTGARDLLLKKLDAGGFSAVSCNSAEDLRDKADYRGIAWTKKYGRLNGLQRYGHIRSLVLSDAAQVFEKTKNEDNPSGSDMIDELN